LALNEENRDMFKAGLCIEHNEHKSLYEIISIWIYENTCYNWKNEEAKQRAIETDEVWTMQWHPDSPVSFHSLAAPTFDELLELANSI